uniref:HTH_48 domain-containing protein n=1 Tax=Rhodnius prolixus TaxID=13249 RepID=T1HMJ8_RHOPR
MKGKTPEETKEKLDKHYGDSAPSISTVYKWFQNFRSGHMGTSDAENVLDALLRIYSNWAQPTDRQGKTLDSHALCVAALMVAKSRSRQVSPQNIVHLGQVRRSRWPLDGTMSLYALLMEISAQLTPNHSRRATILLKIHIYPTL